MLNASHRQLVTKNAGKKEGDSKDLFHSCKQYGHAVDSFIPFKKTKEGKRFGFVRFINVFNVDRLRDDKSSRSYGGVMGNGNSYVNILKSSNTAGNPDSPAIGLGDECVTSKDLSNLLMGRVKEVASLTNLKTALRNEGFVDLSIKYLGELWVLLEFSFSKTKEAFRVNVGVSSWFSVIRQASLDFNPDGRIMWVEVEGTLWIRAKEVPGWVPDLIEDSKDEENSEDGYVEGDNKNTDEDIVGDNLNIAEVPETVFDELCGLRGECRRIHLCYGGKSVNRNANEGRNGGDGVSDNDKSYVNSIGAEAESVSIGRLKKSMAPRSGGSFLGLMEEVVKVGQTMGYNMEGVEYLIHVVNQWHEEVMIIGDFNEVRLITDRFGSKFNRQGADVFNSFIANAGLEEVPLGGSAFTWCHKSATKMSKLDRFFVSNNLLNVCPHFSAITLDRYLSDHRPILLHESDHDYGMVPFRFFHHWLELDGFNKFVSDTRSNAPVNVSNGMRNLAGKLKFLKTNMRVWIKVNICERKVTSDKLKEELRMVDDVIDKGLGSEERNQSNIRGIMADGVWEVQPNAVKREYLKHFQDRFAKPMERQAIIDMCYPNTITGEQRADLEREVTIEEIKTAVWNCGIDKSPGLDGFTFDFYLHFCSIIDTDVHVAVIHFFKHGDIPGGCNSSFIALIPKISDANMVKDFRPISLISSIYKIIAKILTNRLVTVLGNIVSEVQSAFIAGRQILDGPFILNEVLHWCSKKNKKSLIFKVDFEKAYDSVRWDFLEDVLKKFGFGNKWCNWILCCLNSSKGSILVNGSPTDEFQFYKGLKINLRKSKIMGVNVDYSYVNQATIKLGCQTLDTPFMYFGTKVGGNMSRVQAWQEVVEKVKARLSKWKMNTLSIGDALWTKVIKAIHGDNGNVSSGGNYGGRSCWSSIVNEVQVLQKKGVYFFDFMKFKLGNGGTVKFWLDRWHEDGIIKDIFPRVFALEETKEVTVRSKLRDINLAESFRRRPRGS
nr:RNA-directed DNA polymerase, eukaryota [Tanacetum cinerariifolium]